MQISFPQDPPQFTPADPAIAFPVLVDATRLRCEISAEALESHYGAASCGEGDLRHAFAAHRDEIEEAARRMIESAGGKPIKLTSGFFPFLRLRFFDRGCEHGGCQSPVANRRPSGRLPLIRCRTIVRHCLFRPALNRPDRRPGDAATHNAPAPPRAASASSPGSASCRC